MTYRTTTRMVEPLNWLSREVGRWDPTAPDDVALLPPGPAGGFEFDRLILAFHGLRLRLHKFVQRERDFTRDASHELRTPLTVIRVATDLMLSDPEATPRTQRSLARIQRAGLDMEAVIDAFLILARETEVKPQQENYAVRDIVQEELDRIRPLLVSRSIGLRLVGDGAPQLLAPPHVLRVMLGNLLSNAVQFTDGGDIEVRLMADRLEVCDITLGQILAHAPNGADGFWPGDSARVLLERAPSEDMLRGFYTGSMNKRGVHSRAAYEGGDQERELAAHYRHHASGLEETHPQVGKALHELARSYDRHGAIEDLDAKLRIEGR